MDISMNKGQFQIKKKNISRIQKIIKRGHVEQEIVVEKNIDPGYRKNIFKKWGYLKNIKYIQGTEKYQKVGYEDISNNKKQFQKKNIHVLRIQRKTIKSMWHGYLKE